MLAPVSKFQRGLTPVEINVPTSGGQGMGECSVPGMKGPPAERVHGRPVFGILRVLGSWRSCGSFLHTPPSFAALTAGRLLVAEATIYACKESQVQLHIRLRGELRGAIEVQSRALGIV